MVAQHRPCSAVLLDIEGTITPLSFVHGVLFPYAREHLASFLKTQWNRVEVQQDAKLLLEEAQKQMPAGALPAPVTAPELRNAVMTAALWLMGRDSKTTGLKSLQGRIWRGGYEKGELRAQVFEDVPEALERWKDEEKRIAIFSSGSVDAQKLLVRYTTAGDLSKRIDAYFDTTTGAKREPEAYRAIAAALKLDRGEILFATDVLEEAEAAARAGMQAVLVERPGNKPLGRHSFPVVKDFADL